MAFIFVHLGWFWEGFFFFFGAGRVVSLANQAGLELRDLPCPCLPASHSVLRLKVCTDTASTEWHCLISLNPN